MPTQLTKLRSPADQVTRDLTHSTTLQDSFHSAWTQRMTDVIERPPRPLFYDPVKTPTADDAEEATVRWTAFPKRLHPNTATPTMNDFRQGDEGPDDPNHQPSNSRGWQDEYCEWSIEKNSAGKITRVVFTCENPDYWDQLWDIDSDTVTNLYKTFISDQVIRSDLQHPNGSYNWENKWNNSVQHAMHLVSRPNNLFAEVRLAADATIVRKRSDGTLISDRDELIKCANFGEEGRHSDPSIGAAVNGLARDERAGQITLQDPFGLYIDKDALDLASGFELPSNAPSETHPRDYWNILRGTDDFILRVEYSVPPAHGFTVGDIKIDGEQIQFAGQIASKMQIKLTAVFAMLDSGTPEAFFCGAPEVLAFLNNEFDEVRLNVPPGAAGSVTVLCSALTAPFATVTALNGRATLSLGTEIAITNPNLKVFNADVAVATGIDPGPVFFEVSNPDGTGGIISDPGLFVVPSNPPPGPAFALADAGVAFGDLSQHAEMVPPTGRGRRPQIRRK